MFEQKMIQVNYLPNAFFSPLYYPYLSQPGYVAPVVMVQFTEVPLETLMMLECVLEGEGIDYYNKNDKMGSVTFELIVERSFLGFTPPFPKSP